MTSPSPDGPRLQARAARRLVAVGIAVLTVARLVYAALVVLMPQEAYYQAYAAHPALCYLDHPPMVAWWIAAGTALLGHNPLGVRLLGVLSSAALTAILYRLGERLFSPLAGLLVAAVANATALFAIGAVIMTPDVPLGLFWAAALLLACELLLEDGAGPGRFAWRWYALGLVAGAAYLSKYTAALLPLGLLGAALSLPRGRRALRTPHPWLALLLSLAVFSPVLLWNAEHHLASFAFQSTRRASGARGLRLGLVGQYLGAQAAVVTPVIFGALLYALRVAWRRARAGDGRDRLLLWATLPGLAIFTAVSPFMWVKMNWVGPVYLGALVALGGVWAARWARPRVRRTAVAGIALGLGLTAFAHLLPVTSALPLPPRADLWDGWDTLADALRPALAAARGPVFVAGWDYKAAAELHWHLPRGTVVTGANAFGGQGRAFDDWFHPVAHAGATAFLVVDRRHGLAHARRLLRRHCARVTALAPVVARRRTRTITVFHLWRCDGYRPPDGPGDAVSRSWGAPAPPPWPSPVPSPASARRAG